MKYLFGDTDLAAKRLAALDEAFGTSSRRFVSSEAGDAPSLAVDLGCGPGHTTRMLAHAWRARCAVGLDRSEHFVALADQTPAPGVSFCAHDVTNVPLPTGPCDLMYCRFLLTHLGRPEERLAAWATQLRPGGRLLAEEVESVRTRNSVFAVYIDIVAAMLDARGATLYIGRELDGLGDSGLLRRRASEVVDVGLSRPRAANLFAMNIGTWKHDDFVRTNYPAGLIDELEQDLYALSQMVTERVDIVWGMRQMAFERESER